jgi:hypothetical protein
MDVMLARRQRRRTFNLLFSFILRRKFALLLLL